MKDKELLMSFKVTCAECGKEFEVFVPNQYLYKIQKEHKHGVKTDWFCSYKCMHNFKKKNKSYDTYDKIIKDIEEDKKKELIRQARIELEVRRRMNEFEK